MLGGDSEGEHSPLGKSPCGIEREARGDAPEWAALHRR